VRFSCCIDTSRPWTDVVALARLLDTKGWHCLYVCDHFISSDAAGNTAGRGMLEATTTIAALAARTRRARIGTLVLGNTYRHPAVVANVAATLDHVSGGRLVLGLGAGWQENEHVAYGIALPPPGERIDRFEEACTVIASLLTAPVTTFDGRWYRLAGARCEPKPLQAKVPLLVGGSGHRTMRVAVRLADTWHVRGSPAELRTRKEAAAGLCSDIGRDPVTLGFATGASIRLAPSERSDDEVVAGGAGEVTERLAVFAAAGVDEFIVTDDASFDVAETLDQLAAFTSEVLPHLSD
jgi:alkanesulfonate monooxygenase SsuD/methylene tetrahydromethanopterin reductase-like flavin-dependent oxidoreductase (luciferase family)